MDDFTFCIQQLTSREMHDREGKGVWSVSWGVHGSKVCGLPKCVVAYQISPPGISWGPSLEERGPARPALVSSRQHCGSSPAAAWYPRACAEENNRDQKRDRYEDEGYMTYYGSGDKMVQ